MKEKYSVFLFYASVVLLVITAVIHELLDPPDSLPDWISNIAFVGAVAFLLIMTLFVFRPQIRRVSVNIHRMNATLEQMKLLKNVASAANEADSTNEGLQIAIDTICEYTGWEVGHVYLYSAEKNALVSSGIWHVHDDKRCTEFREVSAALELAPHQGFVGAVYSDSKPMWILNVADSSVHTRRDIAVAAGLKAAFAFPVLIGRKAVAVMEFYSYASTIPDEELLSVMANIGKQLGQTIERAQFQERAFLLETVLKSANDSIIITKADLDSPGPEIIYVNEAFTKISGYTAEEAIGKSPRFLQSEFTKRETLDGMKKTLLAGKPFKDELLNVNKDGKNYWLDISIVPVKNAAGVVTHFAAIERDITAKKEEEIKEKNMWLQLKRANMKAEAASRDLQESLAKAEEANKAKGDFLANMSHELRTPMNGVLGMAGLLADTPLNEEQQELVSTINSSGENLLMLLNDILDFSKIEAGALELENIAFNLTDAVQKTANLLRPQATKKGIELRVDCESSAPLYVWGDSGRIRQIITNLLGNAIKFTERGHVRLKSDMQETEDGYKLYVSVEDTGMGIPAHKLSEIFDKFTQADASVTRRYGGTGLGLAITKHLVGLMGGEIGVESAEAKGSTFWFSIPCKLAKDSDETVTIEQLRCITQVGFDKTPIGKARALLVDDYHVNQVFAEKLLRKFGFQHIDKADDGFEALLKCNDNPYDIIFMDCQMPKLDGYITTQEIRARESSGLTHTLIIAMTANAMMGDREKCLNAGMDDYLSKPLRAEHLKKILQTWFILDENKAHIAAGKPSAPIAEEVDETPVDMEQLRMFTDGDPAEEKALADLFLDQAQEMIAILEQSKGAYQNEAWKSAAHRFKGSSGNLGAMKLHQLCKHAEAHSEDSESQKMEMLMAIKAETKRVEVFFTPA
jgi:PAS domain S-box-containing protein